MTLRARSSLTSLQPGPRGPSAEPAAAVNRLAASQMKRMRRIVDAAVRLAEEGGFEGVKLRDVAEASDVALGTLYKYFRSKEDILLFAMNELLEKLESSLASRPPDEDEALERVTSLFVRATRTFTREPRFARAVLRAMASGDPALAPKIAAYHLRMTRLIVSALRGEKPDLGAAAGGPGPSERESKIALMLQHVWFAALVGWAAGLHAARAVSGYVRTAAALMLGEE